ncbi:MAG: 3-methyladenine DNA glycosylase [Pseudonocardia sp. SCN 73-27]|nr:MAG: 3-methyladenine DNA glycosylase [Pseudonocardia sp. SCN 72-51]ODV04116.1 MAG: 3-methyladenine DNA glycosylase [Pseudonocardia sp. SCN 73-27]
MANGGRRTGDPTGATSARSGPEVLVTRAELTEDVLTVAPRLLGTVLEADTADGPVAARIVEVEAYRAADDPASHSYRGRTPRNAVMFGPAGRLYVYFVYGMHFCANVSCLPDGEAGAVLLRAGEVVSDLGVARTRRPTARRDDDLARGPARLASLMGLRKEHNGIDVTDAASPVRLLTGERVPPGRVMTGPRVGVAAAADLSWRFWDGASCAVSAYRPGRVRDRHAIEPGRAQ